MKEYEAFVDVFFSTEEDNPATVITLKAVGETAEQAHSKLCEGISSGSIPLPEGALDYYVWEIYEEDLLTV